MKTDLIKVLNDQNVKAEAPVIRIGDTVRVHIKIKEGVKASDPEFQKLVMCCPAALYKMPAEGDEPIFDYAGCLECGTCRMICGETILEKWEYPQPTMGIEYRFG